MNKNALKLIGYAGALIALAIGVYIAYDHYEKNRLEDECYAERHRAHNEYIRTELKIPTDDVDMTFMDFDIETATLSGRIINKSDAIVTSMAVDIQLYDCPSEQSPLDACVMLTKWHSYKIYDPFSRFNTMPPIRRNRSYDFEFQNSLISYTIRQIPKIKYDFTIYAHDRLKLPPNRTCQT